MIGDVVPASLGRYYELLDVGDALGAADTFGVDALYAVPQVGGPETDGHVLTRGRVAIGGVFAQRSHRRMEHRVEVCALDGDVALVEGRIIDDATGATLLPFLATARIGGDGLIGRYVAFSCPVVLDGACRARIAQPAAHKH